MGQNIVPTKHFLNHSPAQNEVGLHGYERYLGLSVANKHKYLGVLRNAVVGSSSIKNKSNADFNSACQFLVTAANNQIGNSEMEKQYQLLINSYKALTANN